MKKLFCLLAVFACVFALISCTVNEQQKLATPSNVEVSPEGCITWDSVENASYYVITINGQQYMSTTNSFQVQNINDDFEYYISARSDNSLYIESDKTEKLVFTGVSSADKTLLYEAIIRLVGLNPEHVEAEMEKIVKDSVDDIYAYGVTSQTINDLTLLVTSTPSDSLATTLAMYVMSSITNDQIRGFARMLGALSESALVLNTPDPADEADLHKTYTAIIEIVKADNYQLTSDIGEILCNVVDLAKDVMVSAMPKIQALASVENISEHTAEIIELRDLLLSLVNKNLPKEEVLIDCYTRICSTIYELLPEIAKVASRIVGYELNPDTIAFLIERIREVAPQEVASVLVTVLKGVYEGIVHIINLVDKEVLDDSFAYGNGVQVAVSIVLNIFKELGITLPEITESSLGYTFDIINQLVFHGEILSALGLSEETFSVFASNVGTIINALINFVNDNKIDEDMLSALVEASSFNVSVSSLEHKFDSNDDDSMTRFYQALDYNHIYVDFSDGGDHSFDGLKYITREIIQGVYTIKVYEFDCYTDNYSIPSILVGTETVTTYEITGTKKLIATLKYLFENLDVSSLEEVVPALANIAELYFGVNDKENMRALFVNLSKIIYSELVNLDMIDYPDYSIGYIINSYQNSGVPFEVKDLIEILLVAEEPATIVNFANALGTLLEEYQLIQLVGFETAEEFNQYIASIINSLV